MRWLMLALFIVASYCQAHSTSTQRVLILHSYHQQFIWTEQINNALLERLSEHLLRANIFIEYLDDRRFIDDPQLRQFHAQRLTHKYASKPPDLIITSDDSALSLVLNELAPWAREIPLVFGGVNIPEQHDLSAHPNHTGVFEGMAIEQNLQLIQQLLPNTRSIVLIADEQSLLGKRMAERAKQLISHSHKQTLTLLTRFQISELYKTLQQLPDDSAVLLLAIHRDEAGRYFSYDHHLPSLSASSRAPIFAMWGNLMMGYGSIGGAMNDGHRHGLNMAERAVAILQGTDARELEVMQQAQYLPTFDYRQLQRFNIPLERLPADVDLRYQPLPFLQQHQTAIIILVLTVLMLVIIISILTINIRRRAKAEALWMQLRLELEQKVQARTQELAERNQQLSLLSDNLQRQVNTDPLTGIANRRLGSKRLQRLCTGHIRDGSALTIAIIDIDHFKRINDQFGHAVGDVALVEMASFLSGHIRPTDTIARWGGEEFLLLMPSTSLAEAEHVCERLRDLARHVAVHDNTNVTISIGVASHQAGESDEILLERADRCLYQAKSNGRDRVISEQCLPHCSE